MITLRSLQQCRLLYRQRSRQRCRHLVPTELTVAGGNLDQSPTVHTDCYQKKLHQEPPFTWEYNTSVKTCLTFNYALQAYLWYTVDMKQSLQDRLKKIGSDGPSMDIQPKDKPKHEAEVLPEMQDVISDPRVRLQLVRLVNRDAELSVEERMIKGQRKPLKEKIKTLLEFLPTKFMCDGNRVVAYMTPRKTVDPQRLLQAGVLPSVIAACTVIKDSYNLKITPPGGEEEDE